MPMHDSTEGAAAPELGGRPPAGAPRASGRADRLGPADLFALQSLRAAALSPDARQVAYAVSHIDERESIGIWVASVATGERRPLPYPGNANLPCWSPDGGRIAFIADGRLRLADAASLHLSEPLTPEGLSVEGRPVWSADGARIAVCLSERRAARGPRRIAAETFRADGLGFVDHYTQRIYVIDLAQQALRPVSPAEVYCTQPDWSPCGRRLLFLARDGVTAFVTPWQRLFTVEMDGGAPTEVLGRSWYVESARWAPGGEHIVAAAARDSTLSVPTCGLWRVDVPQGRAELRTRGLVGHVGLRLNHDMPGRELQSGYGLVVPDREVAYATVQTGGRTGVWRISLQGEMTMSPVMTGERACTVLEVHPAADLLLCAASDLFAPPELIAASLQGTREQRLTRLNDAVLARWPAMEVEAFSFLSGDGLKIDAWFMARAGRTRPLPTVLFIHAGPYLATGNIFRYDFHLLASQGYGVLFANFRGSAGYGESFVRAIMGDWGGRAFPDHMGAVDAAIERRYADPARLGVWGPSHGGFATCWIVGHTARFRAALAEAAVTDFTTLYYLTDIPDIYRREFGGRPHEIPDVYRSRSPLTYAHRCTTPTLLLHGEDDWRCPIAEAEQFHRALLDVGCTTELVRIPACTHTGDSTGPLSARLAQNEVLVDWFARHL